MVFTALFLLYNIAGIYYNQNRHGIYGIEAIPHVDKWRKLPGNMDRLLGFMLNKILIGLALARGYVKTKMHKY